MKKIILTSFLTFALTMPVMAQENDSEALGRKIALAKQYSKAVSVEDDVQKSIEQLIVNVPVDQRQLFKSILERNIKIDRLKAVSELALAETFNEDELKAMVEFYKSPEGKAIKEKMPNYQKKLQPVLEQMIRDSIEAFQIQTQ